MHERANPIAARASERSNVVAVFLRLRAINRVLLFNRLRVLKVFKNRPKRKLIEEWVRARCVQSSAVAGSDRTEF